MMPRNKFVRLKVLPLNKIRIWPTASSFSKLFLFSYHLLIVKYTRIHPINLIIRFA